MLQRHHIWGHGSFDVSGNYPLWRDWAWCLSVLAIPLEWFLAVVIETDWDICVVWLWLKKFFSDICIQSVRISAQHNNQLNVKMANNSESEYRAGWKLHQFADERGIEWTPVGSCVQEFIRRSHTNIVHSCFFFCLFVFLSKIRKKLYSWLLIVFFVLSHSV